jgi:hypothetical protein
VTERFGPGEPRYDLDLERYGALGILEIQTADRDLSREDIERALKRQLDTLGPLDTARITILRRGEGRWRAAPACGAREPNQSAANAAVCELPAGHGGWHAGHAQGPAAAERPGVHQWAVIGTEERL